MKSPLGSIIASAFLCGVTVAAEPGKWVSPDNHYAIELTYVPSSMAKSGEDQNPDTPKLSGTIEGKTEEIKTEEIIASPLISSPASREFAGITWYPESTPKWIDNRYLFFGLDDRLTVIDAARRLMLLNTTFCALTKAPAGDRWCAIRYRGIGRHQETLEDGFQDTLFIIDLKMLIENSVNPGNEPAPFSHLLSIELPGHALSKPVWLNQGDSQILAIALSTGLRAEAVSLNPNTLQIIEHKPLGIRVNNDTQSSAWIDRAAEPDILKAVVAAFAKEPE